MIPSYYEYYNPVKIISGHDALESVGHELKLLGAKRPILITFKTAVKLGLDKQLIDSFGGYDVTIGAIYSETPPDSSNLVVNEIARMYNENNCDSIIALGGGSVLDTAKGVNIVVTEGAHDLMNYVGAEHLTNRMKPLIAIPATSGTGSEVTLAAVINNVEKGRKMAFTSYRLIPDVAILDSRVTLSVPPRLTAGSGMDALTHAVEAYSCIQKNPVSDAYAMSAISMLRDYLVKTLEKPKDKDARLATANASLLAGCAFSNSMCGIVHAMGHAAGAIGHIPHGEAMAILLPFGMEYNMDLCKDYYAELLLPLAGPEVYASTPANKRAAKAVDTVRQLNKKLNELSGMPISLEEAGVSKGQLKSISEAAIDDGAINFNPKDADSNDILKIVEKAYRR